jgi:hypothetical protein
MTTIVKAHNAADFLALVPYLLGFHPHDSIVLVAFSGNRTRGALRFDLPKTDAALACKRIATTMIGMLCKLPEVDALVPVVFTDDRFADPVPYRPFIEVLLRRAKLAGFLVRDALCVASDGWGDYLDDDTPPTGHPLDEISASDIGERIPSDAREALGALGSLGDVTDGAVIPEADPGAQDRVARLLERFDELAQAWADGGMRLNESDVMPDSSYAPSVTVPALIESALALEPSHLGDRDVAVFLWLLQLPIIRDAVVLQFAFGEAMGANALRGNEDFVRGDDRGARESAALLLGEGPRPDLDRIARGIQFLNTTTARAPKSARPAPLSVLAWLHWALGRGSVAGILAEQALTIDPGYGFAGLLLGMLDAGRLPEWAFEADTP